MEKLKTHKTQLKEFGLIMGSVFFYCVLTPIGLILRLFGKDLLNRSLNKEKASYWRKKKKKSLNRSDYQRQF